ncbi:CmpA/NrtA family ABC transporter substrate-binding protein [Paracoccus laeviglucosivorans]|uniref:NitT/TauT family transport system ATP-binding protein n=1 Tax=Paracoccus laeviglucosivorans TaxID=1197861 RepID=A0A521BGG9_9RHOB|nr:CmpA/NrtA family ABC transporter substrate-binding protein [Paracoccus laeviglucosivorans]SMO46204.1 NitT/TauT family transport system ATP-binding protein [Paracoccus laeviglucosivorans]
MTRLRLGYVPLIDAAPLIIAHELGFAAEEGLQLDLIRLGAWAQSRDMLGAGLIDAAHMLVPMPVAQAMGLGPALPPVDLVMFLSHGGQAVAIDRRIEARLRDQGYPFDFADARAAGQALRRAVEGPLRIGVPFIFSTQSDLMSHWLLLSGFAPDDIRLVTVPPPMMADSMASGEVDMFCVGEPWASFAVERGIAALLLPGVSIWAAPPEKGLVLRRDLIQSRPEQTGALMRAVWRAGRWLDDPDHRGTAAEILSRGDYLNLPPELASRGLGGRLIVLPSGELRECPRFIAFNAGAASFPWRSIAALMASRIAARHGLAPEPAMTRAMAHFRTDLYREHLRPAGAALPGASSRIEGALREDRMVAAEKGQMILRADGFFDGFTFEPPIGTSSQN